MAPPRALRCRTHPANLAGWTCDACSAALCPSCTAEETYGTVAVAVCGRCGGRASLIRLHRAERASYGARVLGSWRFLTQPSTLLSVVALGVFCWLMGWIGGCLGALLSAGATWAYLFYVFMRAARGLELEVPDFSSVSDITRPLIRGVVSTLFLWGPAVAYAVYAGMGAVDAPDAPEPSLLADPIFLLIVGWSIFYGPLAFMVAASETSFLSLLNPVLVLSWTSRFGVDYLIALLAMGVGVVGEMVLGVVGGILEGLELPLVSGLLPEMLSLVMPFFMAHVLGLLLHVRGDRVGYGVEEEYYEPALPGVHPLGQVPARTRGAAPSREPGPAEPRAAVAPSAPAAPEQDAASALRAVADAVTARDMAGAVSAYRELASSQRGELAPEHHLFVGRAAAGGGDFALAAQAFETAADVAPNAASAPQALVLLARLCAERMQDAARAQSVYRYIVHRYPGTDASRFAAQRLPPEA